MQTVEQTPGQMNVETISEDEFKRVCEEIYRDRLEIYSFRPGTSRSEAILWMLLGCLISLLSITDAELQALANSSSADPYGDAVCNLMQARAEPHFDARPIVEELLKRVEAK